MGNCQAISEKDISEAMEKSPPILSVKTETWTKDSYGLFDYGCKDQIRNNYNSQTNIILRREGDKLEKEDYESSQFYPEEELQCDYEVENGLFFVKPRGYFDAQHKNQENRSMWKCVKFCKEKGVTGARMMQGDIMKLGRVAIKIRELTLGNKKGEDTEGVAEMPDIDFANKEKGYENVTDKDKFCRICFVPDEDEENPLFCPCDCSGSMRYIHFSCLKQWLKNRMTGRSTNFSYTFNLKNLECELCKVNLPERFLFRGKCFSFLEFPKFNPPYMIFDILRKESKKTRGVHMLKLNYKPNITIGRGSGNDIRMNDISVSRNHAELKLTSHGLLLEDKNSKFGTLVYVKAPFPITDANGVSVQVGRSIMNANVKCRWKFVMKMNEDNEKIQKNYNPQIPKSSMQFKYDVVTDDENIIEIADSDEDSGDDDDDEEGDEEQPNAQPQQAENPENIDAPPNPENPQVGGQLVDADGNVQPVVNNHALQQQMTIPNPHVNHQTDESQDSSSNNDEEEQPVVVPTQPEPQTPQEQPA